MIIKIIENNKEDDDDDDEEKEVGYWLISMADLQLINCPQEL